MPAPKKDTSGKNVMVWNQGTFNPKQMLFMKSRTMFTCYGGAKGGGKAQPYSEPVLTPSGYIPMGDLNIGNEVSAPDGSVSRITGIFEQGIVPIFKITFSDGSWTRCTADHLWTARKSSRGAHEWHVWTTAKISEFIHSCKKNTSVMIPMTVPAQIYEQNSDKPGAYTLGVLLGDGCLTAANTCAISGDDIEIIRGVESEGYTVSERKRSHGRCGNFNIVKAPELREWITKHGLNVKAEHKHVPDEYKNASAETRLKILQGLMDTDGFADKRGHCNFCSISKQLAEDVQWLARSLGGWASIRCKQPYCYVNGEKRQGQLAYIVHIRMNDNSILFRLERKKERCKPFYGRGCSNFRKIVSIEAAGAEQCRCIMVDNPAHQYITRDFVVTHNTHVLRMKAVGAAFAYPGIHMLIIRKAFRDVERNHIAPIKAMLPAGCYDYNATKHIMTFDNGSTIEFGHWQGELSEQEYNGIEYDWIFIDEATQFTERTFRLLCGCLRGANDIPKRMYLTCNPKQKNIWRISIR